LNKFLFIIYAIKPIKNPIKKYICGYCLVINERGEVMLLVVSNINYNTTVINHLNPVYGDLFYVKGRLIEK
jgi:hypothetical protein